MPDNSCNLGDCHDYTILTFVLYLAEISETGVVGTTETIGNVVTGSVEDDVEYFSAFDPLGRSEEPIQVGIRSGVSIPVTVDEFTCSNLRRVLQVDPIVAGGADRFGLDAVVRSKVYQVTLEHTMPNGNVITVRLHRAVINTPMSWLLSPNSPHALALALRALADDSQDNPYGYVEITPNVCASS